MAGVTSLRRRYQQQHADTDQGACQLSLKFFFGQGVTEAVCAGVRGQLGCFEAVIAQACLHCVGNVLVLLCSPIQLLGQSQPSVV